VSDPLRVAVIGGSLGGLTAALVLRDLGHEVDVFERSTAELEARGAGIVVLDETSRYLRERTDVGIEDVTTGTSRLLYLDADGSIVYEEPRRYRYSGWHTIYRALLDTFGREHYHLGREVTSFRAESAEVRVSFIDGPPLAFDLLVCADGIGSGSRNRLVPDARSTYAGYVAWRGTVAEDRLEDEVSGTFADALVYEVIPASHILVYPIPSREGSTEPGRRSLNFVWYRNYAYGEELDDLMTDLTGARHEITLAPGSVREELLQEMREFALANLAPELAQVVLMADQPFVQVIVDTEVPHMAFGRVCLIGDAAFALRPHIAAGTAKAAADAWALAEALDEWGGDVLAALEKWEDRQLQVGRAALERARSNGDRSQFEGTWVPGDPNLAFGLDAPSGRRHR
jgi:2,6-dihydroxypyridine 3-monooxygenase